MTAQDTLQRDFELLNLEIDGALSGAERAELAGRLLADPSLRVLRDSLRRTCAALDAMPDEEPPASLDAATIVASLPQTARRGAAPAPVPARAGSRHISFGWRHAAALAGAALVSLLAFQGLHGPGTPGLRDLAGTLAPLEPSQLQLPDRRGTIEVLGPAAAPTVRAQLDTGRPVVVLARLGDQQLRLENFAAVQGDSVARAQFTPRSDAAGAGVVEVQVVDATTGEVLQSARLRPAEVPNH